MIRFRKVTPQDSSLLFEWANDSEVRRNSFTTKPIELKSHEEWLNQKLNDPDCFFLIGELHQIPYCQIRFEKQIKTRIAIISISISKDFRKKNLGSESIQKAIQLFLDQNPDYRIDAHIRSENTASIKVFIKAGFVLNAEYPDQDHLIYSYNNLKL